MSNLLRWLSVILLLGCVTACTADTKQLVLGVSAEEPGPGIAEAAKQLLVENGLSVEVRSIESSADIVAALNNGDIEFGIIEEPAKLIPGLATVLPLYPSILHVLYKGAPVPGNFADVIAGKSIYAGPPGGPAALFLAQLATYFDVAAERYTVLDNPWVVSPDVYFVFGGLLETDSRHGLAGYRLFSFGDATRLGKGTVAEGIALQFPHVEVFVLPEMIYNKMNLDTVLTLATRTVLVTASSTDVERVFDVTSILFANSQRLSSVYPLVTREMHESIRLSSFTLPVHAGARRLFDKDAPTLLQRYAQVFALGLTFTTLLISALVALYKSRKTIEKDRIDVYYNKVLALRRGLQESPDSAHRHLIGDRIKGIQNEVFSLLAADRVCANESLTIFLELSNQVLNESLHGHETAGKQKPNVAYARFRQRLPASASSGNDRDNE